MKKKTRNIILWSLLVGYLVVLLGFTSREYDRSVVNEIDVNVKDSATKQFLTSSDIMSFLIKDNKKLIGSTFEKVNTREMAKKIERYPSVKKVDVFTSVNGELSVDIYQRKPIVRLMGAKDYFIDEEGLIIPLPEQFSAHVLIANGYFEKLKGVEEFPYHVKEEKTPESIKELYKLASFINNNEFWRAQIEQVYRNDKNEYELVSRVGAHIIYLGGIDNIENKFKKLYTLYKKGFSVAGWNKYDRINLKYSNQVVCTKR